MSFSAFDRALTRVEHILVAIDEIEEFTFGVTEAVFLADRLRMHAVTRLIEIIGEAAKHLAPGVEDRQPTVPWRLVRSMRDRIVHEYDRVDPKRVWSVATEDLAPLRAAMQAERHWLETR
jgi:uncharacterized protein with HEPN domain